MIYGRIAGITLPVARIIQGTTMMKSAQETYAFALFDSIFAQGGNAFDTAHLYGHGDSERTLGRWIRSRGIRDQVVLIDKGAHPDGDRRRVTPAEITRDLLESLERLQTEYIDLYLLHRDDPSVPVGPIVEVLNEHRAAGLIRAFGGSNWTTRRLAEANDYARERGLTTFAASSPHFSLAEQIAPPWPDSLSITGADNAAERRWYAEHDLALLCWSALAGGWLSGQVTEANQEEFRDQGFMVAYTSAANWRRLARARQMARERGTSVAAVALAYVLSQPMQPFAVVAAHQPEEFSHNAEATRQMLSQRECAWLNLEIDEL